MRGKNRKGRGWRRAGRQGRSVLRWPRGFPGGNGRFAVEGFEPIQRLSGNGSMRGREKKEGGRRVSCIDFIMACSDVTQSTNFEYHHHNLIPRPPSCPINLPPSPVPSPRPFKTSRNIGDGAQEGIPRAIVPLSYVSYRYRSIYLYIDRSHNTHIHTNVQTYTPLLLIYILYINIYHIIHTLSHNAYIYTTVQSYNPSGTCLSSHPPPFFPPPPQPLTWKP